MSDIIKTSAHQLQMPSISGVVNVPLVELDKMRSEHAAAVRMAQELESKQGQVKIVYEEIHRYPVVETRETSDRGRRTMELYRGEKTENVIVKTEYKGFDEFREQIRQEEFNKLQKEFKEQAEHNAKLESAILATEKEKSEFMQENKDLLAVVKERDTLKNTVKHKEEVIVARMNDIKDIREKYQKEIEMNLGFQKAIARLEQENKKLQHKKGFWSFLKF